MSHSPQAVKGQGAQSKVHNPYLEHRYVREEYDGLDVPDSEITEPTIYQEVYPKSILNKIDSPDIPYRWGLNPYQGCEHGCIYCYARHTHNYWGYDAGVDFERKIMVKKTAPTLLRAKLRSRNWEGEPVMLSGNTDCYQPVERELGITRQLLEVFLEERHPVGMITKNDLILRDLDILKELASRQLVTVAVSITTLDERLRRALEPRTSTGLRRLNAVKQLSEAGIPVTVMMAPVIPGLNSTEIPEIIQRSAEAGASGFHHLVVRLNHQNGTLFEVWAQRHYPDRANKLLNQIKKLHGGSLSDSRSKIRMRGEGAEADAISALARIHRTLHFKDRKPAYQLSPKKPDQLSLF
ncbi:PA0069 family radical SAM protein [bacterium SCSIO 12741]|nr:PA0069 family radical SAM protein [bacterium SCSIO 12741]